jgi:hypothetical protein
VVFSFIQRLSFFSRTLTAISAKNTPREVDSSTILEIAFTHADAIPISSLTPVPAVANSELRIYFIGKGNVYVKKDLGYNILVPTEIPCQGKTGIPFHTGTAIRCKVYPGEAPYLEVTNYLLIPAATPVAILVPTFNTPTGDFTVTVKILKSLTDVYDELGNASFDVALVPIPVFSKVLFDPSHLSRRHHKL